MKRLNVKITFTEDMLGTAPNNPDIHREFVASKSPNPETIEEEVAAIGVDGAVEKSMTVFPKGADGIPFIYDYMVKGFFKEAAGALKKVKGTKSADLKAHKKEVDNLIFVFPREIKLDLKGTKIDNCQRPLRASTAQGERVSLANSEVVSAGSTAEFTVQCLVDADAALVKEWLEYGRLKGLGQWRNSGKGRFIAEVEEEVVTDKPKKDKSEDAD